MVGGGRLWGEFFVGWCAMRARTLSLTACAEMCLYAAWKLAAARPLSRSNRHATTYGYSEGMSQRQ